MSRWDRDTSFFDPPEVVFDRGDKLFFLGMGLFILLWLGLWIYALGLTPPVTEFEINGEIYHGRGVLLDNAYRIKTTDGRIMYFPLSSTVIERRLDK